MNQEGSPATASIRSKAEVQQLGRYRIQDVLGRGAMGVVYKSYDPIIDRMLAIKTIRLDVSVDQDEKMAFYERFFREAQTAGKLSHPNIVTIHDIGEDQGITFIAMELIEGVSLQHYLDHPGSLTLPQILDIVREVALGLEYAHKKQIVHRDIKPANIMILPDDRVKITDFGIAKISTASALTHSGVFLGSPNYMSPEQVTGKTIDGRSDIFSLGTVFYELVTGKKPFQGEHVAATIYNVANLKPARPKDLVPDLPAAVNRLVKRALQKNPDARYQTAKELVTEIDLALADLGVRRATPVEMVGQIGAPTSRAMEEDVSVRRAGQTILGLPRRRVMDGTSGALGASLAILVIVLAFKLFGSSTPTDTAATSGHGAAPPILVATPASADLREKERRLLDELQANAQLPDPRVRTEPARPVPSPKPVRPTPEAIDPAPRPVEVSAKPPAPAITSVTTHPTAPPTPTSTPAPAEEPTVEPPAAAEAATPSAPSAAVDPRSAAFHQAQLLNQYVQDLQNAPSYRTRLDAAENLANLRDERAVPYLQYSAQNDDSVFVRTRCRKILKDSFGVEVN